MIDLLLEKLLYKSIQTLLAIIFDFQNDSN
jgi:hypothetical protein